MYIHSAKIGNYSIHESTAIDFYPLTVLVGPCGSGKSAIFDALLNFSMLARGRIATAFGEGPNSFRARRHRGAGKSAPIGFEVVMSQNRHGDPRFRYEVSYEQSSLVSTLEFGIEAKFQIKSEILLKEQSAAKDEVLFKRVPKQVAPGLKEAEHFLTEDRGIFAAVRAASHEAMKPKLDKDVSYLAAHISRLAKYRLNPQQLRRPALMPDTTPAAEGDVSRVPWMDYEGDGLSSLLFYLNETDAGTIDAILNQLREAFPAIASFDFNVVGVDRIGFSVKYSDQRGTIPAANLSDGTLILIGALTLLNSPTRPPIIFLEEPENGLHPAGLKVLYNAMREAATDTDGRSCQIVFSSHSASVLCDAWNGEDRDFIYQIQVQDGKAVATTMKTLLEGYHLASDKTGRKDVLTFKHACEILAGNRSPLP